MIGHPGHVARGVEGVVGAAGPQQGGIAADFDEDAWQLYHTDEDRAEAHDLADEHPEKVEELVSLWYVEAGKYDVLPLDNRSMEDLVKEMPVAEIPEGGIYRYYPNTSPVPEHTAAKIRGRSFKILAQVELDRRDAEGVIIANGAASAATPCSSRTASSGTSTTSSASRPSSSSSHPTSSHRAVRARAWTSPKERSRRAGRGDGDGEALRRRPRSREERVEDAARPLRAVRRGARCVGRDSRPDGPAQPGCCCSACGSSTGSRATSSMTSSTSAATATTTSVKAPVGWAAST